MLVLSIILNNTYHASVDLFIMGEGVIVSTEGIMAIYPAPYFVPNEAHK